ncbi:MAG: EthD domain-containing protein, partial [Gammaproteobacteria bacterium]|nr:EthD domain-containing protein [Gammaproteobacteria bacterium]
MTIINPGAWADPTQTEARPWSSTAGIVKFLEFPVRLAGLSRRAFHLHWLKHHSPHVMNITVFAQFMRKYNTSHVVPEPLAGLPAHYRQDTPFEGCAEVWLNSLDQVGDWLGQPVYEALIAPDELRFIDHEGGVEVVVVKEETLFEPDPDLIESRMAKAYLLTRRRPGLDYGAFHAAASAHGQRILEHPTLRAELRKLVVSHKLAGPVPLEGFEPADIDAVFEFWFEDMKALLQFFADPLYAQDIISSEAELFDAATLRMVVTTVHVVHDEFSFQP